MDNNLLVFGTVFLPLIMTPLALLLVRYNRAQRVLSLLTLAATVVCSAFVMNDVLQMGPQVYRFGGWQAPYGIILVADTLSALFALMGSLVLFGGVLYAMQFKDKSGDYPAFFPLYLFMSTGILGGFLTGDLFSFFVFIELMVISSVTLVAISDNKLGLEAAMKYVFIAGMGSLFLLLGIAAMYATFGTLNFAHIAQLLSTGERPLLAGSAAIMLMASFLLKSAVVPFHFWQPDFHTTAPTPVSALLSSIVVKVSLYAIIRMLTLLFTVEAQLIQNVLLVLGFVGIFYGSFAAMRTYNGKRLLAYSTIAQVGFILVAIGWGNPLALVGAIIYIFNHAFIKSALLMLMGVVSSYTYPKTADFKDIRGVGQKIPELTGLLWFIGGMALAGLPPMNGFISKLALIRGGLNGDHLLTVLLVIGSGILTLLYMMRAWQHVFQVKLPESEMFVKVKDKGDSLLAPAFLLGISLLLGLYARPLVTVAELAVREISDPTIYIEAVRLFGG